MSEISQLTEKQLKMQELCKVLSNLETQRDGARVNRINSDIAFTNLQSLIVSTNADVARLEADGIKRPSKEAIDEAIKEAQSKQLH